MNLYVDRVATTQQHGTVSLWRHQQPANSFDNMFNNIQEVVVHQGRCKKMRQLVPVLVNAVQSCVGRGIGRLTSAKSTYPKKQIL